MKKIFSITLILFSITLIVACDKKATNEDVYDGNQYIAVEGVTEYPVTITDKFGNDIVIENEPDSIVSFSPEFTEIIFSLKAGDKLIGRSTYCDYPEEAMKIETVGDLFNLNVESIVEKGPDLVLLSSMASIDIYETLTNQGLKVLTLDADTNFEGTYSYISTIGLVLNKNNEANDLISNMKTRFAEIVDMVETSNDKPTVYFVTGCGEYGDSAATGDTFIGKLIEFAGGKNAAADGSNWMYSVEKLVEKDPNIVIISKYWDTKAQILSLEGYKDLTAVKENRLYEVDENIFYRQGPRIIEALEVLVNIIRPDLDI